MGASLPSGVSAFCSLGISGFFSSFAGAAFSGSFASFSGAGFSGSSVAFCGATFSGSFSAFSGVPFPAPLPFFAERPFPTLSPLFPGWPFPAPLPFFPVRRLRALSAPSPERGSRPPRTAPNLCPDRLRQSGFSIFHRPFAIPPSWFSGMKKGLDLSCQAPVVGLPPFPAPMKKPPFVVKERFFSRLAVHYFVFLYVSLCTLLQVSVFTFSA